MNFSERVVVHTDTQVWQPSPMPGVWRKPLAREDVESGHATSLVKYDAGSHFAEHNHPGGEEILVLDGVFSDETGDYGPGTYIRNPPGTSHSPFSVSGCILLVKLHQFAEGDAEVVRVDTMSASWLPGLGGLSVMPLHRFGHEQTALVLWPANEVFQSHRHMGGEEIFVLSGTFQDEHGSYAAHSWLRSPHLSQHHPFVDEETIILVKTGHLPT